MYLSPVIKLYSTVSISTSVQKKLINLIIKINYKYIYKGSAVPLFIYITFIYLKK